MPPLPPLDDDEPPEDEEPPDDELLDEEEPPLDDEDPAEDEDAPEDEPPDEDEEPPSTLPPPSLVSTLPHPEMPATHVAQQTARRPIDRRNFNESRINVSFALPDDDVAAWHELCGREHLPGHLARLSLGN